MVLDRSNLLERYDRELRARPEASPGLAVERCHGVVSLVGYLNLVLHWELRPEDAETVVRAFAARYAERGQALEWHVYAHDGATDLARHLAAHGFIVRHVATLMVTDTDAACAAIPPVVDADIRRVTDLDGLQDYAEAGIAAFGIDDKQMEAFGRRLDDPRLRLFTAYAAGRPVAAACLETGGRSGFGRLFSGGVAPAYRGTGLYRGLVAARAQAARELGVAHLVTTALESSRPIFEHLGFRALSTMTCWLLPVAQPSTGERFRDI